MPTIITVRTECGGGEISPIVWTSKDLHGFSRLTLLVHGYNDSACAAWDAYQHFLALDEVNTGAVRAAFGELCTFYWPGDSRALSGASYPFEIPRAKESAALLGGFLRQLAHGRATPLELLFVCHSLGNRLLLEWVDDYLKQGAPAAIRCVGALMMAPAVMVSMVEHQHALEPAAAAAGDTRVLCSTNDPVLKWAFGFGEVAAGEGFGTAVGRRGEPAGLWSSRQMMENYRHHGAYWTDQETGPQVKIWLGLPAPRILPTSAIEQQDLPDPPRLVERRLPGREIGADAFSCACPGA